MSLVKKNITAVQSTIILQYLEKWLDTSIHQIEQYQLEEKLVFAHLCTEKVAEFEPFWDSLLKLTNSKKIAAMLSTLWQQQAEVENSNRTQYLTNSNYHFEPFVHQGSLSEDFEIALKKVQHLPTFAIIDIVHNIAFDFDRLHNLIDNKGDCLLYFDFKKITRILNRKGQIGNLQRLFGIAELEQLQQYCHKKSSIQKEQGILAAFSKRLENELGIIAPPFCYRFCDEKGKADNFFIFLTKQQASYECMRAIMTQNSQVIEDGIGNFEYNAALQQHQIKQKSQTLFGAMFELEQQLIGAFRQKTLQVKDIYDNFHFGKTYTKQNYLDAIKKLDKKQQISVRRKRNRFGYLPPITEHTFVSFNR